MKRLFSFAIPFLVLTFASFSFVNKNTQTSGVPLIGTRWKVVELDGQPLPTNATAKQMYLELKVDNTVSGNGGCNSFSGTFKATANNKISFGDMVRTNILCSGIDYERKFMNVLSKADHYKLSKDTLLLEFQMTDLVKLVAGKK